MAEPQETINREASPETAGDQRRSAGDNTAVPYKVIFITALITTALGLIGGLALYVFGLIRGDLKTQILNEINQTTIQTNRDIADFKTKLAVLETKVDNLDRHVFEKLRAKAISLGIPNPQISLIDLNHKRPNFTVSYHLRDKSRATHQIWATVLLVVTLTEVKDNTAKVEVEQTLIDYRYAKVGEITHKQSFDVPLQDDPPVLLKITQAVHGKQMREPPVVLPPVTFRLAVLDRPSPNIIVFGAGITPATV